MARQNIGIGTVANDGTGDTLRDGGDKINDNFIDLYDVLGWGFYVDAESSPATQTITSTPSKLQIDGSGSATNESYLPREIRGSSSLWDTTNDKILPINDGDSYNLRIDFEVTGESAAPNEIIFQLDIGGGASPSTVIVSRYVGTGRSTPYTVSVGFPIFTLTTFKANGGQVFLSTDTGSITVASRQILIVRDFSSAT